MALGLVGVQFARQLVLEGAREKLVAVLAQEHKQLRTMNPAHDRRFCSAEGDGGLPELRTHELLLPHHGMSGCLSARRSVALSKPHRCPAPPVPLAHYSTDALGERRFAMISLETFSIPTITHEAL